MAVQPAAWCSSVTTVAFSAAVCAGTVDWNRAIRERARDRRIGVKRAARYLRLIALKRDTGVAHSRDAKIQIRAINEI
jgi:hypothetical protein